MIEAIEPYKAPQSKRYTDQERAAAYLYWRTAGGRSIRKTSIRFSITPDTIYAWRDRDDWITKANQEDHDDYASSRIGVAAIVVNELVPSIETARTIRDDPTAKHKDRLAAAMWLAGLAGVSPVSKIETAVTDTRANIVDVQPNFTSMSITELRDYELSVRKRIHDPSSPVVNGSRSKS
jgi:hypothetical protein